MVCHPTRSGRTWASAVKTAGAARLICVKLKAKRQDCIIVAPKKK